MSPRLSNQYKHKIAAKITSRVGDTFPERGGFRSRVFLHATAAARHNRAVW